MGNICWQCWQSSSVTQAQFLLEKTRLEVLLLLSTKQEPIPRLGTEEESQFLAPFFLPAKAYSCFRHHVLGRREAEQHYSHSWCSSVNKILKFLNSAELTWGIHSLLHGQAEWRARTEDFIRQIYTNAYTRNTFIPINFHLFWSRTEYEMKGLIEKYCASIQKDMIHITHLRFLLIARAAQTTWVSNTIKILSKNYCSHWLFKNSHLFFPK